MRLSQAINDLSDKIKRLDEARVRHDDAERLVYNLLLLYHKSLNGSILSRPPHFNFEKANPYADIRDEKLADYNYAMRALLTLCPYNERFISFLNPKIPTANATKSDFRPYDAAFSALPFINFTPLCLYSPGLGKFYIYPTFILYYSPASTLHEVEVLSLKRGMVDLAVLPDEDMDRERTGALIHIALWKSNLMLQFAFSPIGMDIYDALCTHCASFGLPIGSVSYAKIDEDSISIPLLRSATLLHDGVASLPAIAESLHLSLRTAAETLASAFSLEWYGVSHNGTPWIRPISYTEYIVKAIGSYSAISIKEADRIFLSRISADFFNASLFYVRRLFQLAGFTEEPIAQPSVSKGEGVVIDLLEISFSIKNCDLYQNLGSLPIMQALFIVLLPDVPLTLHTFKSAFLRWPHAMIVAASILKRVDRCPEAEDAKFYTVRYAAQSSMREANDAIYTLRGVAQLMANCCGIEAQQDFPNLIKNLAPRTNIHVGFDPFGVALPVLFEFNKIIGDNNASQITFFLLYLSFRILHEMPHRPKDTTRVFFILSDCWGTLPFLFYETALRLAQLPFHSFRYAQYHLSRRGINPKELIAAFQRADAGVLVVNILPMEKDRLEKELALFGKYMDKIMQKFRPDAIFLAYVGKPFELNFLSLRFSESVQTATLFVPQRSKVVEGFLHAFMRLAVFYQIDVTREAKMALRERFEKSRMANKLLISHAPAILFSFFHRALKCYAERLYKSKQYIHIDSIEALTADDIRSVKYNKSHL